MQLRTTFFLLVLAVLIASFILIDRNAPDNENGRSTAAPKLMEFEPEKVIYWFFSGERGMLECLNEHGQWMITKPLRTRAKDARVNYMLSVLSALPQGETITAAQRKARGLSLADYGLAKPLVRIVLGSPDRRTTIAVGNLAPLKDSVFVQVNDSDTVVATATNLLAIIPRELADIRDPYLFSGAPAYIKKLEIKRPDAPLILVVKEGSEWVIRKPILARADWIKMTAFLDLLFNAQATRFVTDTMTDSALYGLGDDEAVLQIGVWQNENENGEYLLFGKKADDQGELIYAYLRGHSSVFTVKAEVVNSLTTTLNNLRDARLFFMAPDSFAAIRIAEGDNFLQLLRDQKNGWQISEPKKWKADEKTIEDLIARLNSLRIEKFLAVTSLQEVGLDKPSKSITVADMAPQPAAPQKMPLETAAARPTAERTLYLTSPRAGQEYVSGRFADEDEVYQLSASAVATIALTPLFYRDSVILTIDPATVQKIILKKDKQEQIVTRGEKGHWKAARLPSAAVNQRAVEDVLTQVAHLRATRFESCDADTPGKYGLGATSRTLTFHLSGKEGVSKTLLFGENADDQGVYAMLQGQEFVFVLEKVLAEALLRDIIKQ